MEKTILTIEHEVAKPLKLSDLKDFEVELLHRVIEISREAKPAFTRGISLRTKTRY